MVWLERHIQHELYQNYMAHNKNLTAIWCWKWKTDVWHLKFSLQRCSRHPVSRVRDTVRCADCRSSKALSARSTYFLFHQQDFLRKLHEVHCLLTFLLPSQNYLTEKDSHVLEKHGTFEFSRSSCMEISWTLTSVILVCTYLIQTASRIREQCTFPYSLSYPAFNLMLPISSILYTIPLLGTASVI
jgi:hypothetical protein